MKSCKYTLKCISQRLFPSHWETGSSALDLDAPGPSNSYNTLCHHATHFFALCYLHNILPWGRNWIAWFELRYQVGTKEKAGGKVIIISSMFSWHTEMAQHRWCYLHIQVWWRRYDLPSSMWDHPCFNNFKRLWPLGNSAWWKICFPAEQLCSKHNTTLSVEKSHGLAAKSCSKEQALPGSVQKCSYQPRELRQSIQLLRAWVSLSGKWECCRLLLGIVVGINNLVYVMPLHCIQWYSTTDGISIIIIW